MLRCDEFTETVTDYLEGRMSLAKRADVFIHLRSCTGCRAYFDQMKATVRLLRQLPPQPSARISNALWAHFRRARVAFGVSSSGQAAPIALAD
ncbi:MAG TPA: zf-HC2 domain-containing protein [Myxococcaceae bacterium]|nr:zf-HC2 domain-containing protein [Myxococcaceae bacterium]